MPVSAVHLLSAPRCWQHAPPGAETEEPGNTGRVQNRGLPRWRLEAGGTADGEEGGGCDGCRMEVSGKLRKPAFPDLMDLGIDRVDLCSVSCVAIHSRPVYARGSLSCIDLLMPLPRVFWVTRKKGGIDSPPV